MEERRTSTQINITESNSRQVRNNFPLVYQCFYLQNGIILFFFASHVYVKKCQKSSKETAIPEGSLKSIIK